MIAPGNFKFSDRVSALFGKLKSWKQETSTFSASISDIWKVGGDRIIQLMIFRLMIFMKGFV